jgi:hypothetical protein
MNHTREAAHRAQGIDFDLMAQRLRRLLSPRQHWQVLEEGFFGTRKARRQHATNIARPPSAEAGLAAIAARWPTLVSPETSEPIFILSAGWRSGSTFLQRWLMRNNDLLIWGEPFRYAEPIHQLAYQVRPFAQPAWPPDFFFADQYDDRSDFTGEFVANLYPSMQEFLGAHLAYFRHLFIEPSTRLNRARWGLKEVALTADDACYLKWLFPRARFLFLFRNPYHAFRSYRQWRNWYRRWPDEPVFTAARFGKSWKELTTDFLQHHGKVGGLLLPYEQLRTAETRNRLEEYLGLTVADPTSVPRVRDRVQRDVQGDDDRWVPRIERYLLKRAVEPVAIQLGYRDN